MSKIGISIDINVSKILKERLYQGKQGVYLNLTTFIDTENQDIYGNNGFIGGDRLMGSSLPSADIKRLLKEF